MRRIILAGLTLALFCIPGAAFADIVDQQVGTNWSVPESVYDSFGVYQWFDTSVHQGTLDTIVLQINNMTGSPITGSTISIGCRSTMDLFGSSCGAPGDGATSDSTTVPTGTNLVIYTFSSHPALTTAFWFYSTTGAGLGFGANTAIIGSNTGTTTRSFCSPQITNGGHPTCDGMAQNYYIVQNVHVNTDTRIISWDAPASGSISTSTTVSLNFTYYFNCADPFTRVGVRLRDITGFADIAVPESSINACGQNTFGKSLSLTPGHDFIATPYISASSTGQYLYGDPTGFETVFSPYPLNTNTASSSVSSSTVQAIPIYQGLLNSIQNNPPFGFIFAIINDLKTTSTSTPAGVTVRIPDFERDHILHPFDVGFSSIVGLIFAIYIYKRFVHFEF